MNPAKETRKKRNRRGVTVVETVIAMVIISIVSFAAMTVIRASLSTAKDDNAYNETRYRAQAALECFKFSDTLSEFEEIAVKDSESALLSGEEGNYTYQTAGTTLTVTVSYPESDRPAFHATAYGKNGKLLFTVDYEKG